ncbi:MAG: hypothetical protein MJZ64_04940 [Paludibacteraceae bacterium]|nr:hypothetical protein [Paludibacteraceae bacterium]
MKKTMISVMLIALILTANAREKVFQVPDYEPSYSDILINKYDDYAAMSQKEENPLFTGKRTLSQATNEEERIGYTRPNGTFFLGMDEKGEGTWMNINGIIGAWSDTLDCWVFPNITTGKYKSIKYENRMMQKYSFFTHNKLYSTDGYGNYCDSIVSKGGWDYQLCKGYDAEVILYDKEGDEYLVWKRGLPIQTVIREDGRKDTFQLLLNPITTQMSPKNSGIVAGGLPSRSSDDGLWPLTLAEPIQQEGVSMEIKDANNQILYQPGSGLTKMVTKYERPQAPLYVKNITIALGKINALKAIKLTKLHLEIQDMQGKVLATSDANAQNLSDIAYPNKTSKLVTFHLNQHYSAYNELLNEGLLLKEAFQIVLTGFQSSDSYCIYAAKANTRECCTCKWDNQGENYTNGYEPYIQLNGIMPTFETYTQFAELEKYGYKTGRNGDTLDINFVTVLSPYYKYEAHYAGEDIADGKEFSFRSTYAPYDSISRLWNLEIEKPNYIVMSADYEYNIGTESNPHTWWDYKRVFWLQIFAMSTPKINDVIRIGKYGRYTYFRIVSIDGNTNPEEIQEHNFVKKVLNKNGNIRIMREGKVYNSQGQIIQTYYE